VNCGFAGLTNFYIDTVKFQTNELRTTDFVLNDRPDLNFHYVVEKIQDDWQAVVGRPISAKCEYDDIPSTISETALHVAMMGNYNFMISDLRAVKQLAYKVITPMMQLFNINRDRIYFHNELAPDSGCPGKLLDKDLILAQVIEAMIPF